MIYVKKLCYPITCVYFLHICKGNFIHKDDFFYMSNLCLATFEVFFPPPHLLS